MQSVKAQAQATAAPDVDLGNGCAAYSWTPEVHDLYGDPGAILAKMDSMEMDLGDRRIVVLLTESAGDAEVRFFEQVGGGNYAVSSWRGESLAGYLGRLSETILSNRGVHCVGEQVRGLLSGLGLSPEGTVPAPANPRAAFAHTIRAHGADTFVRATAALLC